VKLKPAAAFPGYIHAMSVPMLHLVIHSDPSYDEPEPKKSLVVVVVITGFDWALVFLSGTVLCWWSVSSLSIMGKVPMAKVKTHHTNRFFPSNSFSLMSINTSVTPSVPFY